MTETGTEPSFCSIQSKNLFLVVSLQYQKSAFQYFDITKTTKYQPKQKKNGQKYKFIQLFPPPPPLP
jgi:hypothetical protein